MLVSERKTNHSRPVVIVLLRCVIGLKPCPLACNMSIE